MALENYVRNVYGPAQLTDISIVTLQAVFATSGTTITRDATTSSPGTAITRNTTGQFTVTFPQGVAAHLVSMYRMISEAAAGQFIDPETLVASTGTLTFETSTTKGTAADPADGERISITLLVFNH